jgi:enoyl-CoA hydratase/carnithine racemase
VDAEPGLRGEDLAPGVRVLTLARPEAYNALDSALTAALHEALVRAAGDGVRALVLHGDGPGFCAGHDLGELRAQQDPAALEDLFRRCSAMMMAVAESPVPVIAAVHGVASAAGCQLVASCDLAVASERARFVTPGVNIGLFCATPMVPLTRAVPRKRAMEMLLLGEAADARAALEMGLVNRVTEDGEQIDVAVGLAERIASRSARAVRTGKALYRAQLEVPLEEAYRLANRAMAEGLLTLDAVEGIDAFLEKRAPRWPD